MRYLRALVVLLSVPIAGVGPVFTPEDGSSVTKHFESGLELEVRAFQVLVDGVDFPAPEMTLDAQWTRALSVEDRYLSSAHGRPTELERTFDAIAYELEFELTVDEAGNSAAGSGSGTSGLEGRTVRFVWDPDGEAYEGSYVDEEPEEEFPEGLTEDLDLRALLPPHEVDVGDEWPIEPALFLAASIPGGVLPLTIEVQVPQADPRLALVGISPLTVLMLEDWIGEEVRGAVSATFADRRYEGERGLAVIEFTVELASEGDVTEKLAARWGSDPPGGARMERAEFRTELEGTGELLWDLTAGRLHAHRFEADVSLTLSVDFQARMDAVDLPVASELELEGTFRYDVTTE